MIEGPTTVITSVIISIIKTIISTLINFIQDIVGSATDLILIVLSIIFGIVIMKSSFKFTTGVIMLAVLLYLILRLGGA